MAVGPPPPWGSRHLLGPKVSYGKVGPVNTFGCCSFCQDSLKQKTKDQSFQISLLTVQSVGEQNRLNAGVMPPKTCFAIHFLKNHEPTPRMHGSMHMSRKDPEIHSLELILWSHFVNFRILSFSNHPII